METRIFSHKTRAKVVYMRGKIGRVIKIDPLSIWPKKSRFDGIETAFLAFMVF
jgi:hypothetical protein